MKSFEDIVQFYQRHQLPLNSLESQNNLGHFNLFKREKSRTQAITYNRRDYYKITLLKGKIKIDYADKTIYSDKYALMFSDPLVPYSWEPLEENQDGVFCIFTETFFHNFGSLKSYPLFQAKGDKVFILDDLEVQEVEKIYNKMFETKESNYPYKDDQLRNLVYELIHYALKSNPALVSHQEEDRSNKIIALFTELLERQFPLESPYHRFSLKTPSSFAQNLNIHTNHLNKVLKETTGKTTSEHISQRILLEAKALLKHSSWSITDISFALGFEEPSHFTNFFKKNAQLSPKKFRDQ